MNFTCPDTASFFWIIGGRLDTPADNAILVQMCSSDDHKQGCCLMVTTRSDFSVLPTLQIYLRSFLFFIFLQNQEK